MIPIVIMWWGWILFKINVSINYNKDILLDINIPPPFVQVWDQKKENVFYYQVKAKHVRNNNDDRSPEII